MAALNQDFEFYAGEDVGVDVQVEATSTDQPKALTGSMIEWRLIRQRTCEVVLTKNVGNGIVLSDPDNGVFTIVLTHDETSQLAPGRYDHDATLTGIMGNVAVVTVGQVTVKSLGGSYL